MKNNTNKPQKGIHKQLEAVLFAAGYPLSLKQLEQTIRISRSQLKEALEDLMKQYADSSIELVKVASGYVFHIRPEYAEPVKRLNTEQPPSYSRALMETLAIIAYKQPITKAEIEELRGVTTLSPSIMNTLIEHEWIRSAGQKNVPGRPTLWVTTKHLLDSLKLTGLDQLPKIPEQATASQDPSQESSGNTRDPQISNNPQ